MYRPTKLPLAGPLLRSSLSSLGPLTHLRSCAPRQPALQHELTGGFQKRRAAATLAPQRRHHLGGEDLHLLFDLLRGVAARLEPGREHEVVVAAALLDTHDLVDDLVRGADDRDLLLHDQVGGAPSISDIPPFPHARQKSGRTARAVISPLPTQPPPLPPHDLPLP